MLHGHWIDEYVYARDVSFPRREELRVTFGEVGALYHCARPRYPEALFTDVLDVTQLTPPARLLEIGAGTGIATTALAERGFRIVGVEMSDGLAREAKNRRLRRIRHARSPILGGIPNAGARHRCRHHAQDVPLPSQADR